MKRKKKIYISGPISGTNDYMERFAEAEKEMAEKGYVVINPAKVNAELPPPPDTSYEQYMKMSLLMLSDADEIYMMSGWEESKGAKLEFEYAKATKKPVRKQKIKCMDVDDSNECFCQNKKSPQHNKTEVLMRFGKRLSDLLQERNLSPKELAARAKTTETTISRYLHLSRAPQADIIVSIAKALNVTTDYLLGITDYPTDFGNNS